MQHFHLHKTDFAIANGGHPTAFDASNLDAIVTLDLSSISSKSVAADKASVERGTDICRLDMYQLLDSKEFTVAEARAGTVGAGGFLFAGGILISAPKYGW
jgi:hypothetical protein